MADIYVTPYLNPAQITSGTLAYSFGCGKAVISTPYWYAKSYSPTVEASSFRSAIRRPWLVEICELLHDDPRRHAMRKKAYMLGREMIWSHVAHLYMESFQRARRSRLDMPYKPLAVRTLAEQPMDLPGWRLDHLVRMTDSAGILQHAQLDDSQLCRGLLCPDDNARALLLTVLLEQLGHSSGAGLPAGDDLRRLLELCAGPQPEPVSQFLGVRPDLARKGRLGRVATAGRSGCWGLAWAGHGGATFDLGISALRPGVADHHRDDLTASLGIRPDRCVPLPPAIWWHRPAARCATP